eukprot:gene7827-8676_t
MFEKNLNDLVRGIRNSKENEGKYITQCLEEIKQELRQENMNIKANAVSKLIYLEMHGYDISWAAFNIIEVMSSTKYTHKRIGYLAASQCFHEELDVLMLTTNLVKKDMASQSQYDAGVAMTGLSVYITPDLARDLANDIMSHIVSSKSYMRKKAILLMYKVFLNFPEALRPAFPRLKEKLEDQDPGVQCAAVNVICELARKNPRNYLSLAPLFFKLMTTSSNNWMLIKIIKLFGALCPLEPRLGKKLLEPLTNLIHSTSAMSLLYECINTVIAGLSDHMPTIQLCVSKLRLLVEDPDQNLKYLGLLSLNNILGKVPKAVTPHKDLILQCLDDSDESIRYRALDLIVGMITKKNLTDIVKKLMIHLQKSEGSAYRDELLAKIIQICSQSNYQYITNFEWYIDCLVQLSNIENTKHGKLIAAQMLDVAIRVKAVRSYAVKTLSHLLDRIQLLSSGARRDGCSEVLYAAAWVSGEFSQYLDDQRSRLESLLHPRATSLPSHVQGVFIQNVAKLYSRILSKAEKEGDTETPVAVGKIIQVKLGMFTQSSNLEVQERACCLLQLVNHVLKLKEKGVDCADVVGVLFKEELVPVAPKAQKKVPVPDGLDLDKWINEEPSDTSDNDEIEQAPFFDNQQINNESYEVKEKFSEVSSAEIEKAKEVRKQMQASNPHYLKLSSPKMEDVSIDDIPVATLDLPVALRVNGKDKSKKGKKKRRKDGKRVSESSDDVDFPVYEVMAVEGADVHGDDDDANLPENDPHRHLDIDLDKPLEAHEVLPVRTHRIVSEKKEGGEAEVDQTDSAPKKPKSSRRHEKTKKHKKKTKVSSSKEPAAAKEAIPDENEATKTEAESRTKHKKSKSPKKKRSKSQNKEHQENAPTSPTQKATLLAQAAKLKEQAKTDDITKTENAPGSEQHLDDMDFWLSSTDAVVESPAKDITNADDTALAKKDTAESQETSKSKNVPEEVAPEELKSEKPSKKQKKDKKTKKKTKRNKNGQEVEQTRSPEPMLMDSEVSNVDPHAHYLTLGEDSNLKLLYDIKVNAGEQQQAIVSVIFGNLTDRQIISLEFNVLDSLNMKMIRNIGAGSHDPVKVPFQLPSGATNEGQFAFKVESIIMPQWLRGTLTYIVKGDDGSTSEKIDFKINFPVSSFVVPTTVHRDYFANLLAGGSMTEKQSARVNVPENLEFDDLIKDICYKLRTTIVESVSMGASLYGYTIQNHELCLLVKQKSSFRDFVFGQQDSSSITVDAKGTDSQLLGSILNEIKDIFKS